MAPGYADTAVVAGAGEAGSMFLGAACLRQGDWLLVPRIWC